MRVVITGITGTLGQTLLKKALSDHRVTRIVGLSRDEQKQRTLPKKQKLEVVLGDIRDRDRVNQVCTGANVIFHAAALKCVDTLEDNPGEAIRTNILGTENLVAAAIRAQSEFVMASTDKAVYPVNIYGTSKKAAESLVLSHGFGVCRYGNVLGSRGSVIPMFVKSLQEEGVVKITHPEMTRFWIPIEKASDLIYWVGTEAAGGLHIPQMKAASVLRLADSVARVMGVGMHRKIMVGIRPGEKLHECLRTEEEGDALYSNTCDQYSDEELDKMVSDVVEGLA